MSSIAPARELPKSLALAEETASGHTDAGIISCLVGLVGLGRRPLTPSFRVRSDINERDIHKFRGRTSS
jgi:hypothetical protein